MKECLTPDEAYEDLERLTAAAERHGLPKPQELNGRDVKALEDLLKADGSYQPVEHYVPPMTEWPEVTDFINEMELSPEAAEIMRELCQPRYDINTFIGYAHNLFNMNATPERVLLTLNPIIADCERQLANPPEDARLQAYLLTRLNFCRLLVRFVQLTDINTALRMESFFERIKSSSYKRRETKNP